MTKSIFSNIAKNYSNRQSKLKENLPDLAIKQNQCEECNNGGVLYRLIIAP